MNEDALRAFYGPLFRDMEQATENSADWNPDSMADHRWLMHRLALQQKQEANKLINSRPNTLHDQVFLTQADAKRQKASDLEVSNISDESDFFNQYLPPPAGWPASDKQP